MASAWGSAFGSAFGSSWGSIATDPVPSGGGGGRVGPYYPRGPWRVDYLEDVTPPPVVPAVQKPRAVTPRPALAPSVTPWELLNSFGIKPEVAPVAAIPEPAAPALITREPMLSRIDAGRLIDEFRARRLAAAMAEVDRLRRLQQQNAAAFLLLM